MKHKLQEWAKHYLPAELTGTVIALIAAATVFGHGHSYLAAAAAGWVGEGIGFYGYILIVELTFRAKKYRHYPPLKRVTTLLASTSSSLFVEFAPAEIVDNILVRPAAMFVIPQHVHPYALGFLVAKFSADLVFYVFAIIGYELKRRWLLY